MNQSLLISEPDALLPVIKEIRARCPTSRRVVFVSGNFNIVHPGHLRLLNFAAECGDFLVVGVQADSFKSALLPEQLRLEAVRAIGIVDYGFVLRASPEHFITLLKPAIVVKGKEHQGRDNPEQAVVDDYGGKLLFSSGDVRFSSLDLLQRELAETNLFTISKPLDFPRRHGFSVENLVPIVQRFQELSVVVVGDLIVDEYITCDALGMSQEDPTIVVTPIKHDRFVGGAGIVAAHARGLGAQVKYFGVAGRDEIASFAGERLQHYGVQSEFLVDESRPTTLKQRFRANGKTLLRVSHLRQHDISLELVEALLTLVVPAIDDAQLVVFSDFNYGCLPQVVVDEVSAMCLRRGILMVADSQASSQMGDVSRFKSMRLLTPTEHEARLAVRDFSSGLVTLAETLRQKACAKELLITLGAEGLLIHAADNNSDTMLTDRLPALNRSPKDVAGAGDSLFTCTSMALAVGADIWQSAYLGSAAAACQVSRVGNSPLIAEELITELKL